MFRLCERYNHIIADSLNDYCLFTKFRIEPRGQNNAPPRLICSAGGFAAYCSCSAQTGPYEILGHENTDINLDDIDDPHTIIELRDVKPLRSRISRVSLEQRRFFLFKFNLGEDYDPITTVILDPRLYHEDPFIIYANEGNRIHNMFCDHYANWAGSVEEQGMIQTATFVLPLTSDPIFNLFCPMAGPPAVASVICTFEKTITHQCFDNNRYPVRNPSTTVYSPEIGNGVTANGVAMILGGAFNCMYPEEDPGKVSQFLNSGNFDELGNLFIEILRRGHPIPRTVKNTNDARALLRNAQPENIPQNEVVHLTGVSEAGPGLRSVGSIT